MALSAKVGSFALPTATGTQAITGVGFQPKAIMFWSTGSDKASGTWSNGIFAMVGFTGGPTNSYAVCAAMQDGVAASNTSRRAAVKALTFVDASASTTYQEADLQSFDADGFTLNYTTYNAGVGGTVINYLALGGSDITNAKAVNWTVPTTAISKAVTGVGFKPDLVLHGHVPVLATMSTSGVPAYLGFGAMNKHGQQWTNGITSHDAVNPADTARAQQTDATLICARADALTPIDQAHFQSMDADGFSTFFSTSQGTASQVISLCLKGVSSKIGAFPKTTATAPAAQSITRCGFTPKAVLLTSVNDPSATNPLTNTYWNLGAYDGASQRAMLAYDIDAVTPTRAKSIYSSGAVLLGGDGAASPTTTIIGQGTSLDADGFSLSFNPVGGAANEILYLALGDAGVNTFPARVT